MLEKLIELFVAGFARLTPVFEVKVYEGAAVLRRGCVHRTVGPGWHWKWPVLEYAEEATTVLTTFRLPPQTLTTKDDVGVVVAAVVKYSIKDVGAYTSMVFDQKDALADVTMGIIADVIQETEYAAVRPKDIGPAVRGRVSRQVGKFGFEVEAVTLTDFGRVRSIRLIQPHPKDLEN